jgi:hypothetical protein
VYGSTPGRGSRDRGIARRLDDRAHRPGVAIAMAQRIAAALLLVTAVCIAIS